MDEALKKEDESVTPEHTQKRIEDGGQFEPGAHTKALLFATHKRVRNWGGVNFPGLFSSENVDEDTRWVCLVGFLELLGLGALYYALWDQTSLSGFAVLCICVVAILLDIVFAYIHHHILTPKKCAIENEKLRILPDMRTHNERDMPYIDYVRLNRLQISNLRVLLFYGFGASIVILGTLKALGLTIYLPLEWSDTIKTIVLIPCLVSYFIVAYIHLTTTGYLIAYWRYKRSFNSDRNIFFDVADNKAFRRHWRSVEINLSLVVKELLNTEYRKLIPRDEREKQDQIDKGLETVLKTHERQAGPHKIEVLDPVSNTYRLLIYGRLMDSELDALVEAQPKGLAKSAVALYGHYLQMENLRAPDVVQE